VGGTAFRVAEEMRAADAPAVYGAVGMPSLLSLQEAEVETVQDREARRHSRAMLDMLATLQRGWLGEGGADALESLARLVRAAPPPRDPVLASVQRAVLVRAAVELARRGGGGRAGGPV
jgi:hypothetical protein